MPNNGSKYKLVVHPRTFGSGEDLLINPIINQRESGYEKIKIGDIVEIFSPDDDGCHLLLQVTGFNDEFKSADISIESSIAATFNLKPYSHVCINVIKDVTTVTLDSVEITFKDQYMGRSEMWRIRNWLTNTCVYINKKLEFCENIIRCQIFEMWAKGGRVACGMITENTKIVFRSSTSNMYIFVQMSSEMWDFDIHGDLYFEKAINGFLADLFGKWKKLGCNHDVTIVLFSRTFYEAKSLEEFPASMRKCIQIDHKGRFYEDFYRIAIQNDRCDDWNGTLSLLRTMFTNYHKMVLECYDNLGPNIPKAYNSTSAQGNFLEVLNMSLNIFEKHYLDRTFDRTGQLSVVISPGVGIFEVDRELTNITMQRAVDSGVPSDLVCCGEQPLHAVPLLKFHTKNAIFLSTEDYSMPHWINLSFYSTNKKVAYSTFVPRIKLPPLEPDRERNEIPPQVTNNIQLDYLHNSLFDYDEYDAQIFSHDYPPQKDRMAQLSVENKRQRKLSSPDVHQRSNDHSLDTFNAQSLTLDDTITQDHRIVRRGRCNMVMTGIGSRTLINPFDPSHVTVKLTSNRRRWTHIFPAGPTGLLVQQHHQQNLDAMIEEDKESNFDSKSSEGETSSFSSLQTLPPRFGSNKKSTALLWGVTGEQEWSPALTTGVDWKSLTIPACLPITTDFFPEESSLQNDYVFAVYSLLPEDIQMDFAVIRSNQKEPMSAVDVFRELISQRLSQGFQAITVTKKQTPMIEDNAGGPLRAHTPRLGSNPELQMEQLLSIGRIFHKILLNGSSITVNVYRPRHLYQPKSVKYRYRFRTPFTSMYNDETISFTTEKLENFKWNYLDQYVCARGHPEYPLTEDLKYWRFRMFLLPKDDVVTKRIVETNPACCDIYAKDEIVPSKQQCIDDFLRFLETHLNRVKRVQKKTQKATSVSSPLRERLGSTRMTEKIRPRSGSVKVGEKTKLSSFVPLSESHSSTSTVLDHYNEDHEDAFAADSVKLKSNASLKEIFDQFVHPIYGISFLIPAQTMPSCTFTAADAINWISSHMEQPNDPISILSQMKHAKLICHASGDFRKPIIQGFHLYYVVAQDFLGKEERKQPLYNLFLFENEWMEVEISNSVDKIRSIPVTSSVKPWQLYKECFLDVDVNNKSDRAEWGHAKYGRIMVPGYAYEIAVEWIAASGSVMNDLVQGWNRKALNCNFQLIPVPPDPIADLLPEKLNPFRTPVFIPLNFDGIDNSPVSGNATTETQQTFTLEEIQLLEAIATRFGFVPTVVTTQPSQIMVHCTGMMFLYLPPLKKVYTTLQNDREYNSMDYKLGFLWNVNHLIPNRRWKSFSINDSEELFPVRILRDMKCFCSNQNNRLAKFWAEYLASHGKTK